MRVRCGTVEVVVTCVGGRLGRERAVETWYVRQAGVGARERRRRPVRGSRGGVGGEEGARAWRRSEEPLGARSGGCGAAEACGAADAWWWVAAARVTRGAAVGGGRLRCSCMRIRRRVLVRALCRAEGAGGVGRRRVGVRCGGGLAGCRVRRSGRRSGLRSVLTRRGRLEGWGAASRRCPSGLPGKAFRAGGRGWQGRHRV